MEEFLAWEEGQELRYEFDGTGPVAMTGGTYEHDATQVNLIRALANRLAGTRCRTHGNSIKIEVMGSIRYSDAFVTYSPIKRGSTVLHDPVVIFEVLSRGTAHINRMTKNWEYAPTASVRRYVMFEQKTVGATTFERVDRDWVATSWPKTRSSKCRRLVSRFSCSNSTEGLNCLVGPLPTMMIDVRLDRHGRRRDAS